MYETRDDAPGMGASHQTLRARFHITLGVGIPNEAATLAQNKPQTTQYGKAVGTLIESYRPLLSPEVPTVSPRHRDSPEMVVRAAHPSHGRQT